MPLDHAIGEAETPLRPASPPPTRYAHRVRVRYAECDPMNVAHHASYAVWLEEARTEMLRVSGITYAAMEAGGMFLVITRLETTFRRPIRYDDLLEIRIEASAKGRTRLRHAYELALIERLGSGPDTTDPAVPADGVCAIAATELACVDRSGRPQPMPAWLLGDPA
jgi:acyl-CoA thioester hydrolase